MSTPVLEIEGLTVGIASHNGLPRPVVGPIDLALRAGELHALVGESGSGKTMIGRAILRLLPAAAQVTGGTVRFGGRDLLALSPAAIRRVRGREIAMVFQEPMVSLNPSLTIGFQLTEALRLHERMSAKAARGRALEMLAKVRIADASSALHALPHQFSGGMRQRIMLASVLAIRPRLLIADEPTTALDALISREVMDLLAELTGEIGTAVLLISHDLATVAEYADRVTVLRNGHVVEHGTAADILLNPADPYTMALVGALPRRGVAVPATAKGRLVDVDALEVRYQRRAGLFRPAAAASRAVASVSLTVDRGETLAMVGESGSGKTTIGRAILRLAKATGGSIGFDGEEVTALAGSRLAAFRRRTGMIFQDPYASLDPRMRLCQAIAEPLRHEPGLDMAERRRRAAEVLEEVGLAGDFAQRFPHELSGGQRQRACIARAIVARPDFIVADEPVSALDVTVQAQVLALMAQLQARHGFAMLFISHDLGVVEQIADRVAVMYRGRLLETGPRDAIFDRPRHPYTRRLLAATPRIVRHGTGYALARETPAEAAPPAGHAWYHHGSTTDAIHSPGEPQLVPVTPDHWVACAPA